VEGVHSALGLLEIASIARGYTVTDAMVKKAPVRVLESRAVTPGKYLVLVAGDVAEVDESMKAGLSLCKDVLIDQLFLPQAHDQLAPLLAGKGPPRRARVDALSIVESGSVGSTLLAADAAAKATEIWLLELRLAVGIGGKGYFSMTGELYQVQAAVDAATAAAGTWLVGTEIIARPHEDLTAFLASAGRAPPGS
jgi:microcompartment protein CcmL/EutN